MTSASLSLATHSLADDERSGEDRMQEAVADQLVASAEPAVVFASLAQVCVPMLAQECAVDLVDDLGAAFQVRHPALPESPAASHETARVIFSGAPARATTVTVEVSEPPCAGEPGYTAAVTFRWREQAAHATRRDRLIAELVTNHAAQLVRAERLNAALQREADRSAHLTVALATNRDIGQALGILMATRKLTSEQAFELMRRASQQTHRKLRDIAEEVSLTGTVTVTLP